MRESVYTGSCIPDDGQLVLKTNTKLNCQEETGELKILSGLRKFKGKEILEVRGLEPRADSPSWSMMAWIKLEKGKGAQILRKPLGKTPNEAKLSCWSWYVGEPANRVCV